MMAARASKTDGQIALALSDVMRDEVDQQVRDAFDELLRLRERADITRHAGVPARQMLKLRDVIRIRQKADVENQVAVWRDTVTVTKAGDVDADLCLFAVTAQLVGDHLAQFVNVELRGVDDVICQLSDGGQLLAF